MNYPALAYLFWEESRSYTATFSSCQPPSQQHLHQRPTLSRWHQLQLALFSLYEQTGTRDIIASIPTLITNILYWDWMDLLRLFWRIKPWYLNAVIDFLYGDTIGLESMIKLYRCRQGQIKLIPQFMLSRGVGFEVESSLFVEANIFIFMTMNWIVHKKFPSSVSVLRYFTSLMYAFWVPHSLYFILFPKSPKYPPLSWF